MELIETPEFATDMEIEELRHAYIVRYSYFMDFVNRLPSREYPDTKHHTERLYEVIAEKVESMNNIQGMLPQKIVYLNRALDFLKLHPYVSDNTKH